MSIFLKLFLTFFKIGAFTFGGGYAMLPLIQEELIKNSWLSEEEILNFIAVSESTPGPFAINAATYVGNVTGGVFGSVCATLGVVLPSFIVILIVARFYGKFKNSFAVKGVMTGLRPAVIGLISAAIVTMGKEVFFPNAFVSAFTAPEFYISALIFITMLFFIIKKKLNPIYVILISAAVGIGAGYIFNL